jgi:tetratricopeptide (TPR) repeat protein
VLIYGVVKHAGNDSSFQPEFVVSSSGFRSQAPEITGQNQLGKPLFIDLPFQRQGIEAENPAFVARSEALNLITMGLVYFASDNYPRAMDYFQQAIDLPNWLDDAGKEVAYLLMGNARTRQASRLLDTSQVPQAIDDYDTALEIREKYYDATYGRALVGKASATYVLAFLDPQNPPTPETLDHDRLTEAEMLFNQALALEEQPESSRLPQKIAFGLGQIYQTKHLLGETNMLEKARQQYQSVVEAYQDSIKAEQESRNSANEDEPVLGDVTLRELASFAYARLALIEADQKSYDRAVELFDLSIGTASPYWRARYTIDQALIYAQRAIDLNDDGQKEAAQKDMQIALEQVRKGRDLASNLPDRAMVDDAGEWLDELQRILDEEINKGS